MRDKLTALRKSLDDVLPDELNTDFHLDRWLTAYDQDIEQCCIKFREYLSFRTALGFDKPLSVNEFYQRPEVQKHGRFLVQSKLDTEWINEKDNAILFVEMPFNDPKRITKALRMSEYVKLFFGYCEAFQNAILAQEKKTGKRSYGICIYDQKNTSCTPYMNPLSPVNKMLSTRVKLWMDYYSELLKRVIIVNSPYLLSIVWKVASVLIPEKVHNRFCFAKTLPDQLLPYLSISAIPTGYGGKYRTKSDLPNGCNRASPICDCDLQESGQIWRDHNLKPFRHCVTLRAGETYKQKFLVSKNQCLLYEYNTKSDVEFWVSQVSQCFLPTFHRGISNSASIFELWNVNDLECLDYCINKAAKHGDGCASVVFHKDFSTCQLYGHDGTYGEAQIVYASRHVYYNRTSFTDFCADKNAPKRGYQFKQTANKTLQINNEQLHRNRSNNNGSSLNQHEISKAPTKTTDATLQTEIRRKALIFRNISETAVAMPHKKLHASKTMLNIQIPETSLKAEQVKTFANRNCAYSSCPTDSIIGYFVIDGYAVSTPSESSLHGVDQTACAIYCSQNINKAGDHFPCYSMVFDTANEDCWLLGRDVKSKKCESELVESPRTRFLDKLCIPVIQDVKNACPPDPQFQVHFGKQIVSSIIDYSLNIASASHCIATCVNNINCKSVTYKNGLCHLHSIDLNANPDKLMNAAENSIVVENGCNQAIKQQLQSHLPWSEWSDCSYGISNKKVRVRSRDCGKASCTDLQARFC